MKHPSPHTPMQEVLRYVLGCCWKFLLLLSLLNSGMKLEAFEEPLKVESEKKELEKNEESKVAVRNRRHLFLVNHFTVALLPHHGSENAPRAELPCRHGHYLPNGLCAPLRC